MKKFALRRMVNITVTALKCGLMNTQANVVLQFIVMLLTLDGKLVYFSSLR